MKIMWNENNGEKKKTKKKQTFLPSIEYHAINNTNLILKKYLQIVHLFELFERKK